MLSWQFLMFMRFVDTLALILCFAAFVALAKALRSLAARARRGRSRLPPEKRRSAVTALLAALALSTFTEAGAEATSWPPKPKGLPPDCVAPLPRSPHPEPQSDCVEQADSAFWTGWAS
jgi:hypothetical protein